MLSAKSRSALDRASENLADALARAETATEEALHAKEADIAKYRGRYDAGYEPVRSARRARGAAARRPG